MGNVAYLLGSAPLLTSVKMPATPISCMERDGRRAFGKRECPWGKKKDGKGSSRGLQKGNGSGWAKYTI